MRVNVTVGGNPVRTGFVQTVSAGVRRRLAIELEQELQAAARSERSADPDVRRDALERAVRRVWGATL